ncbi:LPXTG cell wall anchor domain-containing protein [Enterococcus hirae]|uniref:SpaA isopeptide-forming pilin-related protein n=2 Tax=Enterococcus TaxID=1350 RepID=UPI0010945B46|nr:SpaA isopeptide-forming pilin-related protein [Enterococcus hirae]TGY21888.1 LPXTG cell wall anchor domain-containing protein [Enterococcus hirae]
MKFNQFNKIRKKITVFMLLLSLSGIISQPLSALAETKISNQSESSQVEKSNSQKENKDITNPSVQEDKQKEDKIASKGIEGKTEQSIPMVTESSITDDTGASKEKTTSDSSTEQSDQVNRQSLTLVPAKTEDQLNQEVKKIFADNGYELLDDGSIRSTTGTSYRSDLFEVLQKVEIIKAQNQAQARATLGSAFFVIPKGSGVVYVDSNYGDAAFHWSQSNGNVETGYYAKKDGNGNMLWCVEPGAPLSWGSNTGFTTSEVSDAKYVKASLIVYWGWEKQKSVVNAFYTEKLVQEITTGVKPTSISDLSGQGRISLAGYESFKKEVMKKVNAFYTKPSFDGKTYTIKLGETLTLTDSNNSLSYYKVLNNNANVSISQSGNTLKVTPTSSSNINGFVRFKYEIDPSFKRAKILYQAPWLQNVIFAGIGDPAYSDINIKVLKNGNVKIKKVDADTGKAISGAKFKLSYGGKQVEVVTNANGEADLKDVPHGTKVTIQEIQAANSYVLNKTPQTVTIEANKTVTATFKNKKQVGRLDLIKEDKETENKAQGSAKLEGAVYGLFETNGQKVKEVSLKKSGDKVTGSFENMQILHDYYVQEIKAPEGYTLDPTKYPVNIAYAGQDKEVAVQSMTLKDQVIKGGIEIVKIGNKPLVNKIMDKVTGKSDNVKPKLEGAEFTITSKTTGKPVKVITTDKDGKASTGKTLPYDSYVMEETKTPEGYLSIDPIEFTISEEDQKFFWVLEDKIIEARLHLVKVDAETGKNIPLRDTAFKIWDRWANAGKGDYVSMRVPNSLEVSDEFKTNDKGELVTSDSLPFGKDRYEIRELRAPEGYLLATEPVVFSVNEADAGGVITILFKNMPQKGQVKIHKTGEKGISTVEKEGKYGKYVDIHYDQMDLAGVKFKVRAAEDITTPDGTVRLAKDEYVQKDGKDLELVTNDLGETLSDPNLYIGKYEAIETEAPSGYVMQEKPIPFEIKYKGQLVELYSADVEVENPLQKINVYGYKKQEVVTGWEDGKPMIELENAKNGQVFGLYVGEEGLQIGYDILPEGNALAYAKVEDGKISFEGLTFPNVPSNYYLQEVNAGKDHVLDETKYTFQYVPSSNEKEHNIHVFADGYAENKEILTKMSRKEIENKLAYTDVELIKTDNLGNKSLEGVEFQLIRVDGKKETVIDTYKTDKDGKIAVKKLPTGSYKFKEIKPLNWYYPNTDDLSFEVTPETNGQLITLKAVNKRQPMKITTLLATVDGKKEADPTVDNTLRDKVEIKGAEVGHTYYIETPYVDPATKKVITTVESTYTAKSENETIHVDIPIAKNTMKDGQKGVATHYIYYDKEKTKEVGKEDDLKNKDQTVTFKTPKFLPKTNELSNVLISMIGLVLFVCASVVVFVRRKSHK